jgi:ferredoxin
VNAAAQPEGMRLVVDLTRCQGYGQCVFAAPEVFQMPGAEALRYESNPGDEQREKILRAAAVCPVQAIVVDQAAGKRAAAASTRAAGAPAGNGRIVIVLAGQNQADLVDEFADMLPVTAICRLLGVPVLPYLAIRSWLAYPPTHDRLAWPTAR